MTKRSLVNTVAAILGFTLGFVAAAHSQARPTMARISYTATTLRIRATWPRITYSVPVTYTYRWTRNGQVIKSGTTTALADTVIVPRLGKGIQDTVEIVQGVQFGGTNYGERTNRTVYSNGTAPAPVPPPPPAPPPPPPPPPPAPPLPPPPPAFRVESKEPTVCVGLLCTLDAWTLSTGVVAWAWRFQNEPPVSTDSIWKYLAAGSTFRSRIVRGTAADGRWMEDTTFFTPGAPTPAPPPPPGPVPPPPPPTPPPPPGVIVLPEAPRVLVDVTYPALTGATINVPAGGNLQGAINAAACGSEIVLAAGASFTGNFLLPAKGCTAYIVIRGAGPCPAAGTRVTPASAAGFAKIIAPGGNLSPIETAQSAGYWWLACLEITAPASVASLNTLVRISTTIAQLSHMPHHIVLDRTYIHGHATMALRRCVMGNGAYIAVLDSWLTECHENGADAQAFGAWNATGPFLLENNYLAGSGENVMFGGADITDGLGIIPSDIVMRRNHFHKPPTWKALWYTSKNLLEFKSAQRVLVEGNVFENNWPGGQSGHGHNWKTTVSNIPDTAVTSDINFQYNLVWKSACGIKISSGATEASAGHTARIRIAHNMWADINQTYTGCGTLYQPQYDVRDLTIEYNTGWSTNALITMYGLPPLIRFVFRGNIGQPGAFGVKGDASGEGIASLDKFAPGWVFSGNVLIGAVSSRYPAGNAFPASQTAAGLVSADGKLFGLSPSSAFLTAGPGGTRPGVDLVRLQQLIAGVAP